MPTLRRFTFRRRFLRDRSLLLVILGIVTIYNYSLYMIPQPAAQPPQDAVVPSSRPLVTCPKSVTLLGDSPGSCHVLACPVRDLIPLSLPSILSSCNVERLNTTYVGVYNSSVGPVDPRTDFMVGAMSRSNNISCPLQREYVFTALASTPAISLFHERFQSACARGQVTMVTQLSLVRLPSLQRLTMLWRGPVVAAIEASDVWTGYNTVAGWLQSTGRDNIAIIVLQRYGTLYPVNKLRNLALSFAYSRYVFINDVDFLPNAALYGHLLTLIQKGYMTDEYRVLVVPAFELKAPTAERIATGTLNATNTSATDEGHQDSISNNAAVINHHVSSEAERAGEIVNATIPLTKHEVRRLHLSKRIRVFHDYFPPAHGLTNSVRWLDSEQVLFRIYPNCFTFYEPYVVLNRKMAPMFPETFVHRGRNKAVYFDQLCVRRMEFFVLSRGFLIHVPHGSQYQRRRDVYSDIKGCVLQAYATFRAYCLNYCRLP